jgi:DNA polymerase elongation subunit (family B)
LLQAKRRYAAAKYTPKPGCTKVELIICGMESVRRDNPRFIGAKLREMLESMLVDGASADELVAFARGVKQQLYNHEIPLKQLVTSENISKPLHEYKAKGANVNVARILEAAGRPVALGERVEIVYLAKEGKTTEKAFPYKLFDPTKHALDLGYYAERMRESFSRALAGVLNDEQMKALWDDASYDRYIPSRTSGRRGALARHLAVSDSVYARVRKNKEPFKALGEKRQRKLDEPF